MLPGLVWAGFTLFLMRVWTSCPDWCDMHRYALVCGGVVACILGGFVVFKVGGALPMDWIGKAVVDAAAAASPPRSVAGLDFAGRHSPMCCVGRRQGRPKTGFVTAAVRSPLLLSDQELR